MIDMRQQAVTGVVPPEFGEAKIREVYPSVASMSGLAGLGKALTRTIVLAPLAWMLMAGAYFGKLLPIFACRYTLTNRRLMVRRGWGGKVSKEVPLAKIDDVRVVGDGNTDFFRASTLEIISEGKVALKLSGVPEAEAFRHAILNARNAWVPGMAKSQGFLPASALK